MQPNEAYYRHWRVVLKHSSLKLKYKHTRLNASSSLLSNYVCLLHVFGDNAEDCNIVRGDKKAHKIQFADKILTRD